MAINSDLGFGISTAGDLGRGINPFKLAGEVVGDIIYISPWMYDSVLQGTWAIAVNPAIARAAGIYNTSFVDQDAVAYSDYFAAGTYTCKLIGTTGITLGILKVKIDGTTVATWDMYSGAQLVNQLHTTAGISVATSGVKTVVVIMDGANPLSSSPHYINMYEIVFYRTA